MEKAHIIEQAFVDGVLRVRHGAFFSTLIPSLSKILVLSLIIRMRKGRAPLRNAPPRPSLRVMSLELNFLF